MLLSCSLGMMATSPYDTAAANALKRSYHVKSHVKGIVAQW